MGQQDSALAAGHGIERGGDDLSVLEGSSRPWKRRLRPLKLPLDHLYSL
jgi:hypothetical protein